ncbi:MAG: undecaprenyl/decaprenyl-phosphate alpha-N-acetylglucosaminyl 1-phosphate transferase [Candidatus Komeilibacteria bacterium]|nr:undecaprenyl/decaprenyl-phosphate alpha-N-acetylglucosaminyl 1-phosphate transferase [Candidatus Komeilibacteria bacterium]
MDLTTQFSATFLLGFASCVIATGVVRWFALRFHVVDMPGDPRKIHTKPVPLLGGVALYIGVFATLVSIVALGWLTDARVSPSILMGSAFAGGILVLVGALDDRFNVRWWQQLIGPVAAVAVLLYAGLEIPYVTNPFGGSILNLDKLILGSWHLQLGTLLLIVWMLGMMYTTKLLDGVDGLASSVSLVAAVVLFIVSLSWDRSGSTTSFLALATAGAALGFLVWNFYPAKIFLGEGGSTFLGFMLALLAIMSGGKIATALLVMGVPIFDVAWIIVRRIRTGQHLAAADDRHLHFRLLAIGMSQRQVVLLLSLISLLFGSVSFFFQTTAKLIALTVLLFFMIIFRNYVERRLQNSTH